MVVIPQNVIVARTASALYIKKNTLNIKPLNKYLGNKFSHLNALMRAQVKVELGWVCNARVDSGTGGNVSRFARLLFLVGTEEPGVMALLNHDERDTWFVVRFQFYACLADSGQLMLQNLQKTCHLFERISFLESQS